MNAPIASQHLRPTIAQRTVPEAFMQALKSHFGGRCSTALAVCEQHGKDDSQPYPRQWPLFSLSPLKMSRAWLPLQRNTVYPSFRLALALL